MTLALALLLSLPGLAASPAPAAGRAATDSVVTACPGERIVTRAELRAAGAGRVGDALRLVAPLRAWTVDGFDAEPRDGRGALALLVDGVPWRSGTTVEPGRLDALPLTVSEVTAVVYCPGPRLVAGRLTGATLDVRTAPPPHLAGLADYGNETGDPGPARYRDPTLPNQDHWGPDGEVVGRVGPAWASLRARSFLPTDTAIVARTTAVSARFPEHQTLTATLAARAPGAVGRFAAITTGELPFVPFLRREVALRRRALRVGGRLARGGTEVTAWGGVERLLAPPWAAPDSVSPRVAPWRETHGALSIGAPLRPGVRVGVRGEATYATSALAAFGTAPPTEGAWAVVGGGWAELRSGRLHLAADASLATDAFDGAAPGSGVVAHVALGAPLVFTASARRTPAAAAPTAAYWRSRGLAPLLPTGTPGRRTPSSSADLRLDARPATRALGAGRLAVQGSAALGTRTASELVTTPDRADRELATRRWAEATADAVWTDGRWTLRADGAATLTVSPGEARAAPPALTVGAGAAWRPAPSLDLSARAEAATGHRVRTVRGDLPSRVPGGLVLDLAARRSVWGDRLALALVGHNVLGAPEQAHPLGARLGPRLFGRLSLRF